MASENGAQYNEKVDIYSYGLVIWGFATGEKPMEEVLLNCKHTEDLARAIVRGCRPDTERILLPPLGALMRKCWETDDEVGHALRSRLRPADAFYAFYAWWVYLQFMVMLVYFCM